jgi:membrane protease YdiL (CAAX protease family)
MIRFQAKEDLGAIIAVLLAFILWYGTFVFEAGNFWLKISLSASLLAAIALCLSWQALLPRLRIRTSHLLVGVMSAIVLYGVFWIGNFVLTTLFASAKPSIQSVYISKGAIPAWGIALLLLCITSPAEEIFWRGFVQRMLMHKFPPAWGFLAAVLCYAGVHVCTRNIPLILAALIAGVFWGLLYLWQKSLVPVIISHAVWSIAVFLLFPFT